MGGSQQKRQGGVSRVPSVREICASRYEGVGALAALLIVEEGRSRVCECD